MNSNNNFNKLLVFTLLFLSVYSSSFATGGLFSRQRWSQTEYKKMWIKSIDVTVDITEQIAVTHVDQIFFNELNASVEAIYIFPLPENAMITELVYWVNDVRFVAEIREREDAVKAYNNKLRQWLDPALLEYLGDNLFRLSIVPIDPLSEVRTEITYAEPLAYDLGLVEYVFQLNTLELSSQPLEKVSLNLDATSTTPFKKFSSPSHQNSTATQITALSANHYSLFYGDENFYPDNDLIVRYELDRDDVDFQVLTYAPTVQDSFGTDRFYTMWITPPDDIDDTEIIPKNIVFTADVSSSMEGNRLQQLKESLNNFLDLLNPQDSYNIVTFGTFVETFKDNLVPATQSSINEAHGFVNQLYALGLTNIDQALTSSLDHSYQDTTSNINIFLTDGQPTWGETDINQILKNAAESNSHDVSIFSFGIGDDINRSLLTSLSAENHGYAQFISSDDSIAWVVSNHFTRISKPILRNIRIEMDGLDAWDTYPKNLGDLYWGSQIIQLGLYKNSGLTDVVLKGYYGSDSVSYSKTVNFSDTLGGHRFVPRLWAKSKIDHLMSLIEIYGETDELVNQIIDLSLRFQVLTKYTAFYTDPDDPDNPTAIEDELNQPQKFALHQNYPNPFNPETKISYTLPTDQTLYTVTIKIYDSLGRLIKVLVKKQQNPGTYTVSWNGLDKNGNQLPSGVYLYSLQAGPYKQTRKMILLK
jgi:Ca-activated chloride channel family protein